MDLTMSPTTNRRDVVELLLRRSALADESGQDLLEYSLLVALIALVAVGAVTTVGTTINTVFWTYISGVMGGI
jgi:Flp pilus assembly pilin Flp